MKTIDKEIALKEEKSLPSMPEVKKESYQKATGAVNQDSQALLLYNCISSCGYFGIENKEEEGIAQRSVLNTLEELEPKDAMEGRLIAQLYTLQERGMQLLQSSQVSVSVEQMNLYVTMAAKLFRTANETVEMLQRWRRKGSQTVVVQHVNVEGGGKAIVGGNMVAGGG